jgi:hypothetical protein
LPWFKTLSEGQRLQIIRIGNLNVQADGDESLGINPSLAMNDRLGVAVIGDPLEQDVTQPARRLAGDIDQPGPVLVIVPVSLAVGLDEVAGRHQCVMQPTPMNAPLLTNSAIELFGDPLAVAVAGWRVESVRIDLGREHGQVGEIASNLRARPF